MIRRYSSGNLPCNNNTKKKKERKIENRKKKKKDQRIEHLSNGRSRKREQMK